MNDANQAVLAGPDPPRPERARVWSTRDLALAAFCLEHGLEVVRATRRAREFEFLFRDPEDRAEELAIQFANSPEARFDAAMRALKKLCHRGSNGAGG